MTDFGAVLFEVLGAVQTDDEFSEQFKTLAYQGCALETA